MVKLFRLAQMMIEYLLHVQARLLQRCARAQRLFMGTAVALGAPALAQRPRR